MKFFNSDKYFIVMLFLILSSPSILAATSLQTGIAVLGGTGTSNDIVLGNNDFSFNWTERNISDSKPEKPDETGYNSVDPGLEQPFMLRSTEMQKNAVVPDLFFSRVISR